MLVWYITILMYVNTNCFPNLFKNAYCSLCEKLNFKKFYYKKLYGTFFVAKENVIIFKTLMEFIQRFFHKFPLM